MSQSYDGYFFLISYQICASASNAFGTYATWKFSPHNISYTVTFMYAIMYNEQ